MQLPAEIRTFDIFDTLVARRCVTPHAIFDAVEKKSGVTGFAHARRAVEAYLHAAGDYNFEHIYQGMITGYGCTPEAAEVLKALELEEEFSNLIPVAEHVAEVRPGDLLVSDMYLPRDFILRVVREKCGLQLNPLYLSSHGKSSGKAWDLLSKQFRISLHTGDNPHSDVAMSQQRGVPSRHTTVTAVTGHEQTLASLGYQGLAYAVRETRLAYWNTDPELLRIGRVQIQVNFPLLFLTALRLVHIARTQGYKTILFSARDCYLLYLVFQRLAKRLGDAPRSEYFMTSRIARSQASAPYLNYLSHLAGKEKTLIVDLCGTGWSLTRLLQAAQRSDMDIFLMHYLPNSHLMQQYRQLGEITRPINPLYVTTEGSNELLEALNTASHEMVLDVVQAQDAFIPVFLQQQPDARFSELVATGEKATNLALECVDRIPLEELQGYVGKVENAHIETCYRVYPQITPFILDIARRQLAENQHVPDMLRARKVVT